MSLLSGRSIRIALHTTLELASASQALGLELGEDVDRQIQAMGAVSMTSRQYEPKRYQPHPRRRLPEGAPTACREIERPACAALPDHPITGQIFDALARTMINNDFSKQRRLAVFKDGCRYGKFGKTKAYELIAQHRIRAYKMGGKTMIDLDSVDEFHASLPMVESRAS